MSELKLSKPPHRISLTDEDFEQLVRGGVITKAIDEPTHQPHVVKRTLVEICLQDIGFARMRHHVDEAHSRRHL
jgi:hypothetical protein